MYVLEAIGLLTINHSLSPQFPGYESSTDVEKALKHRAEGCKVTKAKSMQVCEGGWNQGGPLMANKYMGSSPPRIIRFRLIQ